jgi:hypothetical protein
MDGHEPPRHNPSYSDIYPNIGYENFKGSMLVIYQCSFQSGFMSRPDIAQIPCTENVLSLDIEYDDPFWFGIIFAQNKKEEIKKKLEYKKIVEYKIVETEYGSIVIAARKLIPEWDKLKLPKDRSVLGHYTEHECFDMNNE